MNHRPKPLALLVAIICAAAAAPNAQAHNALAAPAATALDNTRWSPGLVWRADEGAAMLASASLAAAETPVQDEPGTAPVHLEPSTRAAAPSQTVARDAAPAAKVRGPGHLHRIRGFVQGLRAKPQAVAAASANASRPNAVRPRLDAVKAAPAPPPVAASAHADRLLQDLAAVLPQGATQQSREALLARLAERFPAAIGPDPVAARQANHSEPAGAPTDANARLAARRDIVVASHTERVLRNLEKVVAKAGLSSDEPDEMIVATQAEKVLAMLLELPSPRKAKLHSGTHRAAVATLRADAAAQAAAVNPEPLARAAQSVIAVDVDIALPLIAEPIAVAVAVPTPQPLPFAGGEAVALSESSLDRVRGGFVTDGLNISFGIERAVYVNGTLLTTTSLNVSDLGRVSGGRGAAALDSGTLALIQSGAGNVVAVGSLVPASLGTVIQNTLDGQKIQNVTTINASVNSLGVLRGLNLQSSLRGAVIDSLRR